MPTSKISVQSKVRLFNAPILVLAIFVLMFAPLAAWAFTPPTPPVLTISGDAAKPEIIWPGSTMAGPRGAEWQEATEEADWVGRTGHASVVFNDQLWVIGGFDGQNNLNDVWSSADGENWTEVTGEADWDARSRHTAAVFDNKIWVMGGNTGGGSSNDVWYSEDGETWNVATSQADWPARSTHATAVFDNKLWVMGGHDGDTFNDVWSSEDGENWDEVTGEADWSARSAHATAVLDEKLWVMGGNDGDILNDVWSSADGENWDEVTGEADWPVREAHAAAVFLDYLWVIGGAGQDLDHQDVWYSFDGTSWFEATDEADWEGRYGHSAVVLDEHLWIMGGTDGTPFNDVWSTPNTRISHYILCWDQEEGGCSNNVLVDWIGEVIAQTAGTPQSWLAQLKDALLPSAQAQFFPVTYTFEEELELGTWYFQHAVVTVTGYTSDFSPAVAHTVEEDADEDADSSGLPGLPDTGISSIVALSVVFITAIASVVGLSIKYRLIERWRQFIAQL